MSPLPAWVRELAAGLACVMAASLVACGGGGGGPLVLELGTDLVVADIDGDGRADVLALSHEFGDTPSVGRLTVRRQTMPGRFAAAEHYAVGCYPWQMTLADIDGDGHADLVVTDVDDRDCVDPGTGNAILLLRQDAARPGRFGAPQVLAAGTHAYQVAVADLDGDGAPDLAYGDARSGARRLTLLIQDRLQRGRFLAPRDLAMPGVVSEIVAGDLDGDHRADLFLLLYGDASGYTPNTWLAVMRRGADGQFAAPALLSAQTGLNVQRLAIDDVDGDRRPDLLAHFTPFSTDYAARLRVLRQGATPLTWLAPVDTSLAGVRGTDGTAFGDLDQDGRPDMVLAGTFPTGSTPFAGPTIESRVNLLRIAGDGSARDGGSLRVDPAPDAVAVADLDGDGRNDVVLHDGTAQWWMRQAGGAAGTFEAPQPLP